MVEGLGFGIGVDGMHFVLGCRVQDLGLIARIFGFGDSGCQVTSGCKRFGLAKAWPH